MMRLDRKNKLFLRSGAVWLFVGLASLLIMMGGPASAAQEEELATGCAPSPVQDYGTDGFNVDDFIVSGIETDDNNDFFLNTAAQQVNPNRIIIPMKQEVFATFISEGAGYESDFGYVLLEDVVEKDDDGNILYKKTKTLDNYVITGGGSDIWNQSDQFHYEYHEMTGNFQVDLRVHSIENTDVWAKVGLMFRETLDDDSRYTMALVTPTTSNKFRFQYRDTTGGTTDRSIAGTLIFPNAWLRLKRNGSELTAYYSTTGNNWFEIDSHDFDDFPDTGYLGIAITSHDSGDLCSAEFSDYDIKNEDEPGFTGIDIGTSDAGSLGNTEIVYEAYNEEEDAMYLRDSYGMLIEKFVGWENVPEDKKHPIFVEINGGTVLDSSAHMPDADSRPNTESALAQWEDGTGLKFIPNGDGSINEKDMRKSLGTFEAGTELVFFLSADHHYNEDDDYDEELLTYFTKKHWNPDTYTSKVPDDESDWCLEASGGNCTKFEKRYQLGVAGGESWRVDAGWMTNTSINSLANNFGVVLDTEDEYIMTIEKNNKYEHVIVGAPADDPNQWILGFEDLMGGGDTDHNDVVFRIERKTGGSAELEVTNAIPASPDENDETGYSVFYTGVTFETWDVMPCDGKSWIEYEVSIDGGETWVAIPNDDWDVVKCVTVNNDGTYTVSQSVDDWQPGSSSPACTNDSASPSPATYRSKRIDFSAMSLIGHSLVWRASFESEAENCVPQILNTRLEGSVSRHASFSRASPGAQANMLYSGTYETPDPTDADWIADPVLRGHLIATRLYDPHNPSSLSTSEVWDAGQQLADMAIDDRNIYFPAVTETYVEEGTADITLSHVSNTKVFTGTLANGELAAGTLRILLDIDGQIEIFRDKYTTELVGDKNGIGSINRFTGAFELRVSEAPPADAVFDASASYVTLSFTGASALQSFAADNDTITKDMLGLNHRYPGSNGDINKDGAIDDSDRNLLIKWVRGYKTDGVTEKAWPLGPIDHSSPALQVPPGIPDWYYGDDIPTDLKDSYMTFRGEPADDDNLLQDTRQKRPTVIYVGSRNGMLHAFDAGEFRWGDNPDTNVKEHRGYFLMNDAGVPNYGTGNELWAFIPASLLSKMKNNLLKEEDQAFVDASPTIVDVYSDGAWRTVVLSALGNGGDSIFCLDVTDPENPAFMWEYTDPDLFRSRSSAAVAAVGPVVDADGNPKWAAFFVSGEVADDQYPSIFMIDIGTGTPISLPVDLGSPITQIDLDSDSAGIGGVISGQPAMVDSDFNGFIDRLYVGTDKGNLYKVTLPDDPEAETPGTVTECVINGDFNYDLGDEEQEIAEGDRGHAIYGSPAVIVDNEYNLNGSTDYQIRIFFGTGDSPYANEDINVGNTKYHFLAYTDKSDKGTCEGADLEWFYEMPAGERIWASAFASAGKIYFGSTTAETEDPCEGFQADAATGSVYSMDMTLEETNDPAAPSPETVSVNDNVNVTPVIYDEHIFARKPSGDIDIIGSGQMNNRVRGKRFGSSNRTLWREVTTY